jgi:hypothetical protein
MIKYIIQIFSLLYLFLIKIRWRKFYKLYNKESKNVIWVFHPGSLSKLIEYLGRSIVISDWSIVNSFVFHNIDFRISFGRNIGRVHDCNIFYHPSFQLTNYLNFNEYPAFLVGIATALENQKNTLFLNSKELTLWENKCYMHETFSKLGIPQPETISLNTHEMHTFTEFPFPYLIKDQHSQGSKGIYKITSAETLLVAKSDLERKGMHKALAQKLINMTRDLRVIVIDDFIALAYWRINNHTKEWMPTSTSKGSSADFGNFPEKWRQYFIDITKKLELSTAAYDVVWNHDDIETTPIILEVSPYYQPNPPVPASASHLAYRDYKKAFFISSPFYKTRVDQYCNMANLRLQSFKNKNYVFN